MLVTNAICLHILLVAGRTTTNEELEDMLESGNPAIFTQGVSYSLIFSICMFCVLHIMLES